MSSAARPARKLQAILRSFMQVSNRAFCLAVRDHPTYPTYLRILLVVCAAVLVASIVVTWFDPFLEPYDAANYVEVGRNLLARRGLSTEVVGNFYRQYPEVFHPEDRRPSAWSVVLAASMGLLGETPFAATLPNLFLGLLVGPLLVWALARRLGLAPLVGFAAAVLFLTWPHWLRESLSATADVLFTDLALLALLLLIVARDRPVLTLAAGAALGAAYTGKPAALLLVIPLAVFFWLDASKLAPGRRLGWLAALAGLALVFASPLLVRNYLVFGNPAYSTNVYTAAPSGRAASGRAVRPGSWGEARPSLGEWARNKGLLGAAGKAGGQLWRAVLELFVRGPGIFFVLPALYIVLVQSYTPRLRRMWVILLLFVLELAVFWVIRPRLLLVVVPVITLSAAAGGLMIAQRLVRRPRWATGIVLALLAVVGGLSVGAYGWWRLGLSEPRSRMQEHIDAARWVKANLPADVVVMSHYPYLVRFYGARAVAQIPFDELSRITQVIEHYGVDTLVVPRYLPAAWWASGLPRERLREFVQEERWVRVYENHAVSVFHAEQD